VQPAGTDRTVSVELVKHGESHLYQKCNSCQVSRRMACQMVMFWQLWIKFITKNPEPYRFSPSYPDYYKVSFTHFWFSKVELDQGNKWKDASLDVPRKV
jgi:hypothetical protein